MEDLNGRHALVSAWRPGECNGAVMAAAPYGAIPLLAHRTRRLWGDLAFQPMHEGGSLLLAGLGEDRVAATEEVLGLAEWAGNINQQTRVHFLPDRTAPTWHTGVLTWAAAGHGNNWMVEADPRVPHGTPF